MQKIKTFLTYVDKAEEAARFYVTLFPNSRIVDIMPDMDGGVLVVNFQLAGQDYIALNGGPDFQFSQAMSLFVTCENQAEVDDLWAKLTADGGEEVACGWLRDRFGVSWQITPRRMMELLSDPDPDRVRRAFTAMMDMVKLDIAALERAADGA